MPTSLEQMWYIIESALLQAKLLFRTLIIPSFIYAISCEYDMHVCSNYARMVNKGDVLGSNEWLGLPIDQQTAWVLPINLMINITHLRQSHPVITVSDYLRLYGHDSDAEAPDGQWQRVFYHLTENVLTGKIPDLYVIENGWWYDPPGTVRVDEMITRTDEEANDLDVEEGGICRTLKDALPGDQWIPIRHITPRNVLCGFKNDIGGRKEKVVLLAGEVHYRRKPGSMRFTTRATLDEFASLVLDDIRRIDAVSALADVMVECMYTFTEGRLWMGTHMRRGDFVRYNWVMKTTLEEHIARVKNHLKKGREFIGIILEGFRREGTVFMDDLLTIEDRRGELSWPLMLTDFRGLVEQLVLSRAVAGGVMNLRAIRGMDPRTADVD
ncbi:hypothetical protein DFS33DRAFT_1374267 [Desarmillaria ectypa]|nr:hypothetical protein DFS33DRAFT_1374267 [Desarmillaria ectypa]